MKNSHLIQLLFATALLNVEVANAQNPIIQTKFTADPAPMVYHDTMFLLPGTMKTMLLALYEELAACCTHRPI